MLYYRISTYSDGKLTRVDYTVSAKIMHAKNETQKLELITQEVFEKATGVSSGDLRPLYEN